MKNSWRISFTLTIIFCFSFTGFTLSQEWSAEQQEVWSAVEDYWAVSSKGDVDGFLSYFHSSFAGWGNNSVTSDNKAQREKFIRHFMPKSSTVLYTITPEAIWVNGNFAFVHYNYTEVEVDMEGKERTSSGRWTDILMKDGRRWVMVGDSGGQTSRDD
jgi:ketosteroid isomerase-like protein